MALGSSSGKPLGDALGHSLSLLGGVLHYEITRTAGAAGPLVLESGGSVFFVFVFCIFFVFYHTNFCSNPTIFHFTTFFTTNYVLPQTTIIIGVSISTTTPIFVPIQQLFNFTKKFTTHFYHIFYH